MTVLDHPETIDNSSLLVIGNLFEVQMRMIVSLEAQITKVLAMKGTPWRQMLEERFASFTIASGTGYDVYGRAGIHIWSFHRTIVYRIVVHGPHTLIAMLVRPQLHIHAILIEQRLQAKEIQSWQSLAHNRFVFGTIVAIVVAAVHRPMAIGDYPWTLATILWTIGLQQILFEPLVLHHYGLYAELCEVVDLRAEADEVHRAQVKAIEEIIRATWHAESVYIMREVAAGRQEVKLDQVESDLSSYTHYFSS